MFDSLFWRAAGERAVRTFAQTALTLLGINAVSGAVDLSSVNIPTLLWASLGAAVLSILTSLVAGRVGSEGPSFGLETVTPQAQELRPSNTGLTP